MGREEEGREGGKEGSGQCNALLFGQILEVPDVSTIPNYIDAAPRSPLVPPFYPPRFSSYPTPSTVPGLPLRLPPAATPRGRCR